jgi:enoyl-CoA hydratase
MALVRYAVERAIATITLDSPENRNALSRQLVSEFAEHLASAAADGGVRAVVLTHTGRTFCAGADLKEQLAEGGPAEGTRRLVTLLRTILELPKPVVTRLDGHVRAGGLGLVGASDLALASSAASFAFTEVRIGVAPAIISLTTLGRLSERAASRYLLTGETFDAATAAALGLITEAVDSAEALDSVVGAVTDALRGTSPAGLAATKPLTTRRVLAAFDEQADSMQALSQRLFESDDAREGIAAFFEKRPPRWGVE